MPSNGIAIILAPCSSGIREMHCFVLYHTRVLIRVHLVFDSCSVARINVHLCVVFCVSWHVDRQPPETMRQSDEPTDRERCEMEIIKSLMRSYFDIARKNFQVDHVI